MRSAILRLRECVVRLLVFLLSFILSGVPATAMVCDLFVCADPAAPPTAQCHGHTLAASGERLVAAAEDCNHLVAAGPYVTSSTRAISIDPLSVAAGSPALDATLAAERRLGRPSQHAPTRLLRTPRDLPLRI
jgi:hypothetical protein